MHYREHNREERDICAHLFRFVSAAGLERAALLPANPSAGARYEWLGLSRDLPSEPQDDGRLEELADIGRREGLQIDIG